MAAIRIPSPSVVELEGEIDLKEAPAVRSAIAGLLEQNPKRLLFDLSGVSYIDSSGLAVLIEAYQKISPGGGEVALCGLADNVAAVIKLARLDLIFTIHPDRAAADGSA
jgi:anti-sigma B factor antagonist